MDRLLTQRRPIKAVVRELRSKERRFAQEERFVDFVRFLLIPQQIVFDNVLRLFYHRRLAVVNVHLSSNQSSPLFYFPPKLTL